MKNPIAKLQYALPALALLLTTTACLAGSIQVTPVRINLSEAAKVQTLTVHNTGTEASVMQVSLNKWTLAGQDYSYKQSQDLIITPATFKLAPGAQQIVRIGLRASAPKGNEDAYRLLVEEVPPPAALGFTGTRMVVRHDLPVFVAPLDVAAASLDIAIECSDKGAMLKISNIGNVHAQLRNVVVKDSASGKQAGSWETFDYLLPVASKNWPLTPAIPATTGKMLAVTTLTDQGSFTADVANSCK